MPVRARFRPHPRGFGFLTPVAGDGATPTTVALPAPDGGSQEVDSAFVPPPVARGLVADDLVDAEVEVDDRGASAQSVTVVDRPRRMLVGTVQQGPGRTVLEPDPGLGTGWLELDDALSQRLTGSVGRQVVVLCATADDGAPVGRALVAGPHVVGSPAAVRAAATIVALGRAAPSLIPGGAAAARLDPAATDTTHVRVMGLLAGGERGAAGGLDPDGPVPGADLVPVDRRDEPAVTVDAATTRDLDDAVAARWDGTADTDVEVAVHIADVGGTVGVGSPADHYARTVGATAYLVVGDNAPMLDPALSEGALSVLPHEDRRVISARFRVAPDGAIAAVEVEVATVRSRARLTYAALDHWLDGDTGEIRDLAGAEADTAEAVLTAALEASRRLGVERDARVTLEDLFDQAELDPSVVDGKLATSTAEPHARAYRLIERLMVAANEAVAHWLVDRDVPSLYRAHAGLDPERLERLRAAAELAGAKVAALEDPGAEADVVVGQILAEVDRLGAEGRPEDRDLLVTAATSSTARASYDPDPSHHRGLAATPYTHFTSPIRRYADLVVHRQVRAALAGEPAPHAVEDLAALAAWLDARTGALKHLQARERGDLWARLLDRGFLDEPEPATVTGLTQAGIKLRLPRLGVPAFVTAERALGLPNGQRGQLVVDDHGLTTTSGPWRLGSRVLVRFVGLDETGRTLWRLGDAG